ncbi:hypothetical protein DPMN_134888 [Dreissena polymorpha]|uniref:Uncharacterized protein n=1 Tax=Dreissena polymorpha TaxID=45954 RepID=A0A9D4G0W9_DREPO|nr:hypothetical protein DPMN_134888 [Dreissena polymorpha]
MARQRPTRLVMGPCIIEIDQVQYQLEVNRCRKEEIIVKGNFGWVWPMWAGHPRIDVQYQFEVNRCRNKEVNFQSFSANSVGGDSGQDGQRDGHRTDSRDNHNIPTLLKKRGDKNYF